MCKFGDYILKILPFLPAVMFDSRSTKMSTTSSSCRTRISVRSSSRLTTKPMTTRRPTVRSLNSKPENQTKPKFILVCKYRENEKFNASNLILFKNFTQKLKGNKSQSLDFAEVGFESLSHYFILVS